MKKHYVTFSSPGTFVAEQTTKEIKDWDVKLALEMSKTIVERYDARPYGFQFFTKKRKLKDFDSVEIKRSGFYYIGGKISSIEDLRNEHNPNNLILIRNMELNNWDKIWSTTEGWFWSQPLREGDIVLTIE